MYSVDLRKKVIEAYVEGEGSLREIANRFRVSFSFVYRLWARYENTGSLEASPHGGGRSYKIDEEILEKIEQKLEKNNDIFQREIAKEYEKETGVKVSQSTVCRTLARMRITRKKNILSSKKRNTRSKRTESRI